MYVQMNQFLVILWYFDLLCASVMSFFVFGSWLFNLNQEEFDEPLFATMAVASNVDYGVTTGEYENGSGSEGAHGNQDWVHVGSAVVVFHWRQEQWRKWKQWQKMHW